MHLTLLLLNTRSPFYSVPHDVLTLQHTQTTTYFLLPVPQKVRMLKRGNRGVCLC